MSLQDYSFKFGQAESRMVDQKLKNPKKDIGPRTLLYQDRCVMCTRCVRVADEIAGTHELCVVNRGSRAEIDVFPGLPLANPLQGNVVDVCPVGAMLDKDFLFKRRVWELSGTPSICPGCGTGCSIRIDQADQRIQRLKPRYNPKVNDWWMCDEGRFGWKYVHDRKRISAPLVRRGFETTTPDWADVPEIVRFRLQEHVREHGAKRFAAVLSPFMACEEAWLLTRLVREVAPESTLVLGLIPTEGQEQTFPVGAAGNAVKFRIPAEKCPNRRGVEAVLDQAGGSRYGFKQFVDGAVKDEFSGAWIVGGYPKPWIDKETAKIASHLALMVVQDLFESELAGAAAIVLPACSWAEREGSFMNEGGILQPFERAIIPRKALAATGSICTRSPDSPACLTAAECEK